MEKITAHIKTPTRTLYVYSNGLSYCVPAIRHTTKRGQVRACYGCKNEREAFTIAKQLARKSGQDTAQWKLELLPYC